MTGGSVQQLVNMYLEERPQYTGNPGVSAIGTPGLTLWTTLATSPVRQLLEYQGNAFAVSGSTLYKLTNTTTTPPTATSVNTLSTVSGRVSCAPLINNMIVFCDGSKVYYYNGSTLTDITSSVPASSTPIYVVAKDGYVLYLTSNTNRVYVSDQLAASTIQALSYFTIQNNYDSLVSAAVSDYFVYFFGQICTEIWYTSGGQTVPFDRVAGGILQYGIVAPHANAVVAENVYFLAQSDKGLVGIVMANGPQAQVVSSADFVSKAQSYNSISDAFMWVDVIDGHTFINITFPTAETVITGVSRGRTWMYNVETGAMSERQSYNTYLSSQDRHLASCQMYINNQTIVGDYQSGNLYIEDINTYTENGTSITRTIVSPHIIMNDQMLSLYNVELDVERGEGLISGQGSAPLISLEISRDKGRSWGRKLYRAISAIGGYLTRIRWGSLGGGRTLTTRLTCSEPIKLVVHGMTGEIELEQQTQGRAMNLE